jgi:hypothetical protein
MFHQLALITGEVGVQFCLRETSVHSISRKNDTKTYMTEWRKAQTGGFRLFRFSYNYENLKSRL